MPYTKTNSLTVSEPRKHGKSSELEFNDIELVEACLRGESPAMELLYRRYKRRVFGLVTRIVGNSDAEEVAQEVFVRIYRGLSKFRGDSQLSTWIYRLAVNASLTHVSKRKRRPECDPWDDQQAAPDEPMRDSALSRRLEDALQMLPAGYRAVIVLHDIEGQSHEQCAAILGCRIGTSKSQLHKARAKMREFLNQSLRE
ncbi:MAG: sigma-70 family RNA polymerase sigma factor [Kofleriaceae bacterium]|nr:sigma-70 family RNA polymerase sigma factor [Kofleriaceae bacterium]